MGNEDFNLDLQNDDIEDFAVDFGEVIETGGSGTSDFNELSNRPKYDSETMTGNTNIPKVPTKTSELTNDADFQTWSEVDGAINTAIGGLSIPTKTSDLTNDGSDGDSTYVEVDELATVATSGKYTDLTDTPTIPDAQIQSDWTQSDDTKVDYIKNKPTIPTVNDATLTITQNGTSKGTFTANDADNTTIEVSDTTYSNFTGTDGTAAGMAGLVPAPATTDAGKFLKADGTWAEAAGGGSGAIELTSANYDYPDAKPTGVALWRLPAGMYWAKQGVKVFTSTSNNSTSEKTLIVANSDYNYYTDIVTIYSAGEKNTYTAYKTTKATGAASSSYSNKGFLLSNRIVQTTGQANDDVMSQKAVTDALSALETRIAALEGN